MSPRGQTVRSCAVVTALATAGFLGARLPVRAQEPEPVNEAYVREHYTKHAFRIPMRDGVRLFTHVYVPKDTSKPYPIMLARTPYSVRPYEPERYPGSVGPSPRFAREGFIVAYQDVRGRYMSEGQFLDVRPHRDVKRSPAEIDESTDTYDTIDWLVKNVPNNNGRVGMWGISYPGFYAAAGMIDSHPALKAASPQAPVTDWFAGDDWHHNGALFLFDAFGFYPGFVQPRENGPTTQGGKSFDFGTPDSYRFFLNLGPLSNANARYFHHRLPFWNDLQKHPNYDAFWKARAIAPHLRNVRAAVMTVGGWFDAEDLYGPLHVYAASERQNPGARNTLVMGPWSHGGWSRTDGSSLGDIEFGSNTAKTYQEDVEFPFFNHYLTGDGTDDRPEARVFATGENRWLSFPTWPPRGLRRKSFYFAPNGQLQAEAGGERRRPASGYPAGGGGEFDEYVSDPAKPVPYVAQPGKDRGTRYMIDDQRFAAHRPDVLVYETEPLAEDLRIAGPIRASLYVSSTGTDADFVVKVVDMLPPDTPANSKGVPMGDYQMLVRAEVMRARFRKSLETPEPLVPGKVTPVAFDLQDVCHTFRKGHRLMVQVQSAWFPLVDRNPQRFVDIYHAAASDFRKATHRVYFSPRYPSHVEVGVRP